MNGALLLAGLLPLLLAPLGLARRAVWLPVIAPLAVLLPVWLTANGERLELDGILLGLHLHMDATGRGFLLFSAVLWSFAGLYAALTLPRDAYAARFRFFFLSTLSGNLLSIVAADMLTFYFGFAVMGLSAYGMVVHRRSQRARRAARVYLVWTLLGEVALFAAVIGLAGDGGSLSFADLPGRDIPAAVAALLIFAFGIKLALPGLHVWLPLTYMAAPIPAVAVMSGPMISTGLLGWLRFMPPGQVGLANWGEPLMILGAAGVALGTLVGVMQRHPRAVLGYSSIVKMGLITAVFGTAQANAAVATTLVSALSLFALHHLLVKGALFIGVGELERAGARPWVLVGLVGLALALAGAPLSGGAAAKAALSDATVGVDGTPGLVLWCATAGTVLLMARFLWLVTRRRTRPAAGFDAASVVWLLLAFLALWLPFHPAELSGLTDISPPQLVGLLVAAGVWLLSGGRTQPRRGIRPGDVLYLIPRRWLHRRLRNPCARWPAPTGLPDWRHRRTGRRRISLAAAGLLWLVLFVSLLAAVMAPA